MNRYEELCKGNIPARIRRKMTRGDYNRKEEELLADIVDICQSLNKVYFSSSDLAKRAQNMGDARLNPSYFSCTCKAHHHHTVCAGVLVASHKTDTINLNQLLAPIRNPPKKRVRNAAAGCRYQPQSDEEESSSSPLSSCGESDDNHAVRLIHIYRATSPDVYV